MSRYIRFGGKGAGFRSVGLLAPVMILLGLAVLVFFFIAAFALAVVLVPLGIVLFLVRRIFFPGKKRAFEPGVENKTETGDGEIIDVTDYKTVNESNKQLKE